MLAFEDQAERMRFEGNTRSTLQIEQTRGASRMNIHVLLYVFYFCGTSTHGKSQNPSRFAPFFVRPLWTFHGSLAGQFSVANLSVWDNKWSRIFNFTGGEGNWSCLPPGAHHRQGGHGIRTGIATKTILGGEAEKTSHPLFLIGSLF